MTSPEKWRGIRTVVFWAAFAVGLSPTSYLLARWVLEGGPLWLVAAISFIALCAAAGSAFLAAWIAVKILKMLS